jgi:hypothetical protein
MKMGVTDLTEVSSEQDKTECKPLARQEQYWHSHYCRWQKSGLSLAGYARSQGLVVNTFYGWHARLKKRGLAKPEPASTVFHRVTVKPTEAPILINDAVILLRFRLPNGIDCELAGIDADNFTGFLETLAGVRR